MTRRTSLPYIALLLVVGLSASAGFAHGRATRGADDAAFPHARHAKLFPTCVGCHAGISAGDSAAMFPPASSCEECHNGRDAKRVAWTSRRRPPTNLRFDHVRHARVADSAGTPLDCARCHGEGAQSLRMLVTRPQPETCIACHAHSAPSHLAANAACATCHVPLVRAVALSDSAVAALPKPPSHASKDFIATHGTMAAQFTQSCATCHARESCARCHVDAGTSRQILALGSDARVARLMRGRAAVYPEPASHRKADFVSAHGGLARESIQTCATCHAQPSCRSCHTGSLAARTIEALPREELQRARGVQLLAPRPVPLPPWSASGFTAREMGAIVAMTAVVDTPPPRVVRAHASDFVRTHGPIAASGRLNCAGCHGKQSFCTSCHQGAGERRYHPFDFVARHPSESFARETNCTSCHNTEVFCRSCHTDVAGIATGSNRRSGAAHSGQPLWLLQHGEAARRGMPSCASCHKQTDCIQCHSSVGRRINPHGPDFAADRMRKANPTLCAYCHVTIPN